MNRKSIPESVPVLGSGHPIQIMRKVLFQLYTSFASKTGPFGKKTEGGQRSSRNTATRDARVSGKPEWKTLNSKHEILNEEEDRVGRFAPQAGQGRRFRIHGARHPVNGLGRDAPATTLA